MGDDAPTTDPVILADKYYCCTVDIFPDGTPVNDCNQTFIMRFKHCEKGDWILDWLNNGWECRSPHELVAFSGYSAQRLIDMTGPYDTFAACTLECS